MNSIIFVIVVICLIALAVYAKIQERKKNLALEEANKKKLDEYGQKFMTICDEYQHEVPSIPSDISLKKGESLYVVLRNVDWKEYRKVRTGRIAGHGVTGKIKLAKGLYYRYGAGQMIAETMDQLTTIDSGDAYFTNKGLFFRGSMGNKSVPYNNISNLVPFMQGLQIERDKGKNIFLPYELSSKPEYGAAIAIAWDYVRSRT